MARNAAGRIVKLVGAHIGDDVMTGTQFVYAKYNSAFAIGILVEGTPYKTTYYIHDFLLPYYAQREHIHLTYSRRLTRTQARDGQSFVGDAVQVAEQIAGELASTRLTRIGPHYGPRDFVSEFGKFPEQLRQPIQCVELAAAYGVVGDLPIATEWLLRARRAEERLREYRGDDRVDKEVSAEIDGFERAFRDGTFEEMLKAACRRNAAALCFDIAV